MEENNNDEKTILDKGKEVAKNKSKNVVKKWFIRLLPKILPVIGIFFLILLAMGLILAAQKMIQDTIDSILGIFDATKTATVTSTEYSSNILEAAQQVHDEERDWEYFYGEAEGRNYDEGKKLLKSPASAALTNPNKVTCCSTYVSCVLYASGYFTEEEIGWDMHSPLSINTLLDNSGWQEITKKEELKPGDIVFLDKDSSRTWIDHVQIYAGDNKWYNAGNTRDIQSPAPKQSGDDWDKQNGFVTWWAYRTPAEPTNSPAKREAVDYNGQIITLGERGEYLLNEKNLSKKLLEEFEKKKVNNEVIGFDTEKLGNMIDKYLEAEVKTSYPKTDNPYNDIDGMIVIKRASADQKKIIPLEYKSYDVFCKKVKENSAEAINWFSINPKTFELCIAKQGTRTEYRDFSDAVIASESTGMTINEINYQKYVQNHITPLNFYITLHLISQDIDFMEDLLDLALAKGKIELTYVDTSHTTELKYDYEGNVTYYNETEEEVFDEIPSITIDNSNVSEYYEVKHHKKITTTYSGNIYVTQADTWVTSISNKVNPTPTTPKSSFEGEAKVVKTESTQIENPSVLEGPETEGTTESAETSGTSQPSGDPQEGEVTDSIITQKIIVKEKITNTTTSTKYTVVNNVKKFKVDKVVNLIKKYSKVENNIITAPSNIFYLLQQSEKTLIHEKIMRYVLFKLTDIDYGVIDDNLEEILSNGSNKVGEIAGNILEVAQQIHDAQRHWTYYTSITQLTSGNIEKAIDNPNQVTCCATYVWSVLYKAGYFTEEEVNKLNYNSQVYLTATLRDMGWEKITDLNALQAGDIVFMDWIDGKATRPDHVQIYAGDNKWYNAGGTIYIQGEAPYVDTGWISRAKDWWAYRPPVLEVQRDGKIPTELLQAAQEVHDAQTNWKWRK